MIILITNQGLTPRLIVSDIEDSSQHAKHCRRQNLRGMRSLLRFKISNAFVLKQQRVGSSGVAKPRSITSHSEVITMWPSRKPGIAAKNRVRDFVE